MEDEEKDTGVSVDEDVVTAKVIFPFSTCSLVLGLCFFFCLLFAL